ncbi:MAG: SUMF1/EgtB/PvdO family nonheme iron enzyme [Chlorobiaceae bacterium]|nr:SUMF1/EgtB/PvdO family nonheme iron enzyme [Chlorobiaceae bacterium]
MQSDHKTTLLPSPEFPQDELLIFIGHSDDATTEANAIKELQSDIDKDFRLLLKSNGNRSPYRRIRLWEWTYDALALPGGQETAVTPALDRAMIAIFVFRERVGKVTWQELERVRKRDNETKPHVFAYFPEASPTSGKYSTPQAKLQAARDWADLVEHQIELTSDWTAEDSRSVTPCQPYQDPEQLKVVVLEKVRSAMAHIVGENENAGNDEPNKLIRSRKNNLRRYQATLKEELGTISLLGTKKLDNIPVSLDDTFVSLRLSDTLRSDSQFVSDKTANAPEKKDQIRTPEQLMNIVFKKNRLLLVIGDPGSGKTTLLKYYVLSCFKENGYQKFGFKEPVLVFYFPLRELVKTGSGYALLPANLFVWSEKRTLGIAESDFVFWLQNRKTLLLLDGLDEISDQDQRINACGWIDNVVNSFHNAVVIVTSRATGYRKGDGVELASLHSRADVMDFTLVQQLEFLKKWFKAAFSSYLPPEGETTDEWEITREKQSRNKVATIIWFLRKKENKSLQALARVPMLLQIMATLWKEREYLPGSRVDLYDAALNYILDFRDRQKKIYPLLEAKDAREVLNPVALWMQEVLKKSEVAKSEMQQKIEEELKSVNVLFKPPTAEQFCRHLVDRSGLLLEYGDQEYRFRHKSFQEYMAGVQLREDRHKENRIKTLVEHFRDDDWWEEPLRYFIAQIDAQTFDLFMQELFNSPVSEVLTQKQQDLLTLLVTEAPKQQVKALEAKLLDPETTQNRQHYILECLKTIGKPEALGVVQKFIATGFSKGENIRLRACEITGQHGSKEKVDKLGAHYILFKDVAINATLTDEQETCNFYVAKYTVTNQYYRRFIGYLNSKEPEFERIISVAVYEMKLRNVAKGIKGFSKYLGEKSFAKLFRSDSDDDKRFNGDNQPVVDISWYAARAYCLWLSLLESKGTDPDRYRLPTDREWEYAAAGKEGRKYPWSKEKGKATSKLANYDNNEGATTPVGRYPDGATPEGLYDMAGNVWEWTDSWYDNDRNARSLRGGSWLNGPGNLRCSVRFYGDPVFWADDIGFRVVRSSHSLSS